VTLAALLEEGMRKELTSWWAHSGVPLKAQFSEMVEGLWEPPQLQGLQMHHVAGDAVSYTRVCVMHCH
jgi:hypothetical protein